MSNYRWIRLLVILSLLVAVLAVNAVSVGLVKADDDDVTVITVPSGDVDALYAAVYDENGEPRDSVEIVLEPGVFFLEEESLEGEARPFGGSLVLGDNTILRSTLDLPLNEDGVPTGQDPCQTGDEPACGAIIDGSELPDIFFDGSYIVTGNGSTVSRLILQGNRSEPFEDRIGIQILPKGTSPTSAVVDGVIIRRTLVGVQIGSRTGGNNNGTIQHSWLTENYIGADVVQIAPDSSGVNDTRIKAKVGFNLINNNANESFTLVGGFGGDQNDMVVSLVGNEFGFAPFAAVNVQMVDNFIFPGNSSNDNRIRFSISGGHISGMTNGDEQIESVGLLIRNIASDVGDGGWDNVIHGEVKGVEFVNTTTDVQFTHVPGPGLSNQSVLLMRDNRHSDDLDGMGQFSVMGNPPETEFLVVGSQESFDEENDNFDSTGLVGHFTEDGDQGREVMIAPAAEEPEASVEPQAVAAEDKIANAMSAGPAAITEEATIMDWPAGWPGNWPDEPGGELIELRSGTNGWTCLPDRPETPTNDPLCLNEEMLAWRKAIIDKTSPELSGVGIAYMLQGGSSASTVDPFLLEPPAGQDWGSGPAHIMILPPGGEDDLAAFGTTPGPAPWVMNSGTPYAHLMVAMPPIPEAVPAEDKIANAMSAGPAAIAEEATIMDWPAGWPGNWPDEPGGELVELRPGSNGWTCLPDRPETPTNDPLCLNEEMLAWRKAIIDKTSPEPSGVGIAYMLQGGSSASTVDPFLLEPPAGQDWGSGPAHVMILTPGGEEDLAAFGTTPGPVPWVMNSGTPYAHLMVAIPAIPEAVALGD